MLSTQAATGFQDFTKTSEVITNPSQSLAKSAIHPYIRTKRDANRSFWACMFPRVERDQQVYIVHEQCSNSHLIGRKSSTTHKK